MRNLRSYLASGALLAIVAGAYMVGALELRHAIIKPALAQPTILGPNIMAYTAVTSAQNLIAANPTRHALQICNPGATNPLWIAPIGTPVPTGFPNNITAAITPAANGGGTVAVPQVSSGVISCFTPPVNAPSIGQGWQGFSVTTPVTIYEWP